METHKILVYSEDENILRELLGKAQQSVGGAVAAYISDTAPDGANYGSWGAETVYTVTDSALKEFNPEAFSDALAGIIAQVQPDLVMVGATKQGLELSARVAERMEMSLASWCVDFKMDADSQQVVAECMIYSGIGVNTYRLQTKPAMVTVSGGVFEAIEPSGKIAEVMSVSLDIQPPKLTVIEEKGKMAAGRRLEDAPVIVDVGQGFKEREDVGMADELAELLSGQVSCSRPISSERDWFPEWIGLSGAQLSPELCFTVGTSGAIQHMIGIRNSNIIVSVNNDEYAGSHYQADYGVVADLYEFLPALIEVIKKRSIRLK
jgi:electron transfer flavoprotein alpha subunit